MSFLDPYISVAGKEVFAECLSLMEKGWSWMCCFDDRLLLK